MIPGAGAMAQGLRALHVLTEDPGSGPSTHVKELELPAGPAIGDPVPASLHRSLQAHICTQTDTYVYK